MGDRRGEFEENMKGMFDKFKGDEGKMGDMTPEQKQKFMKDGMDDMKMKGARDMKFDDHDFEQRIKNGYFNQMGQDQRDCYDDFDKKMKDDRKGNFDEMDKKMGEMQKGAGFKDMGDDDKKKFMGTAMFQMGSNMQQMMKDREEDDDMRQRMGYCKQDSNGRQQIDKQIDMRQGQRTQERMPVMQSESGSVCYPSMYFDKDDGYRGGKGGKMHDKDDMMGEMMKDGMDKMEKDGDREGMMMQGMKGMGGMMDKMNGMEGMIDKMGKMSTDDQEQMKQKLQNMKDGGMGSMMRGGMDGMKEGLSGMMQQKFHSMNDMGGKDDMMSKMGGKDGMMQMMGMTGGKDRDGNDMKAKFEGQMQMKGGQNAGPPSFGDMDMKRRGPDGDKDEGYRGGCKESLCCGHILTFGVW